MADQCGHILTEAGGRILCENGDALVTECFLTSFLTPGKVWKGDYPYFKKRRDPIRYRPPYSVPVNYAEEEELMMFSSIDE